MSRSLPGAPFSNLKRTDGLTQYCLVYKRRFSLADPLGNYSVTLHVRRFRGAGRGFILQIAIKMRENFVLRLLSTLLNGRN